jgi:hypothetical protein
MSKSVVSQETVESTSRIADAILEFIGDIPESNIRKSKSPASDSRKLTKSASLKSSVTAGALALPPGPLGWLTIIPEMITVWKIQAQLVADIAALHGKTSALTQEQMVYCLFRHTAAQIMRDLVVRVGERTLVRRASLRVMKRILEAVGIRITQRTIGKGIARWLPFVGAAGVAGYAYYDTNQVGKTANDFFGSDISLDSTTPD